MRVFSLFTCQQRTMVGVNTGGETETAEEGLWHSAFASRTFIPTDSSLSHARLSMAVSEHILDPSDLRYPS